MDMQCKIYNKWSRTSWQMSLFNAKMSEYTDLKLREIYLAVP